MNLYEGNFVAICWGNTKWGERVFPFDSWTWKNSGEIILIMTEGFCAASYYLKSFKT
jgi:hypothetical protein